jgi:hypothetical protein
MLLTIEGKWLEVIVHMTKSKFLDLPLPKQVQLFISICIHGKFWLSSTFALVSFQEDIQQFIPQGETCRNPNLAKCGGEAQHLERVGIWSPPGLPNVQSAKARGKTPRIGVFLVSLKRS